MYKCTNQSAAAQYLAGVCPAPREAANARRSGTPKALHGAPGYERRTKTTSRLSKRVPSQTLRYLRAACILHPTSRGPSAEDKRTQTRANVECGVLATTAPQRTPFATLREKSAQDSDSVALGQGIWGVSCRLVTADGAARATSTETTAGQRGSDLFARAEQNNTELAS